MVFKIKNIYFDDIESLVCDITNKFDSLTDEFEDVSIIAKYEEAKEIIRELIRVGYDIASLEIYKEDFEEYWDEYILSISKEGGIVTIWCEKFKRESGYFRDQSSITYVLDNCNSKCIPMITSPIQFEVNVKNEDENFENSYYDTDNSESTYISRTKDGKLAGFSKFWSTSKDGITDSHHYSHYSDNEDMVKSIARDFGIRL